MSEMTSKTAQDLFGAGTVPANTRERLIHKAMDLFYVYGLHAVGLDRILSDVGVTKTTFYNHFESKDDLICAVLEQRHRWEWGTWVREVESRARRHPRRMLLAIFDVLHDWFNLPDFRGCQFINAATEFPMPTDPVHQAAARHKAEVLEFIRELTEAAGADDSEGLADALLLLIEGAITMRLVTQNDDAAEIAKRLAEARLHAHLPPDPAEA